MSERPTEQQVLESLRAGESTAFETLVRSQGGRMKVVANRLLANEADADEVVQEAFLSFLRGLEAYRGEARLSSWLHRIVINAALMRLRSRRNGEEELCGDLLPAFAESGAHAVCVDPWPKGPLDEAMRSETRSAVRVCIAQLPDTVRVALILRDLEGYSNEELAAELGITPNAAKLRVHRGRQALRTMIERSFAGVG